MVKKGTKRKTRWRTLPIGDGATDTSETGKTELKEDRGESLTATSSTNPLNTSTKTASYIATAPRNDNRNYYKYSDKFSPSQQHTSFSSYKRRTSYQNASSRYYGNSKSSPSCRSYRSTDTFNKETSTTKPLFNEDDYTRITTPRQDVLFKKGYLSRPKKTSTATDTNTSSSAAMSVVSTEESMSSSTQSVSPEHCNSTPEIYDPEHPFTYPGFYDQNGVFFVNPFMTNGFDPYGGQMIMMPYGGPPYSINPTEYYNHESAQPYTQTLQHQQKRHSIDSENSPSTPSPHNEPNNSESSTPAIEEPNIESTQNDDAPSDSQSAVNSKGEERQEEGQEEIPPETPECNHNMLMQYPQFYYPFMFGPPPPFMPINEMAYNECVGVAGAPYNKYNRFKKRKRRFYKYGNSTGVSATTTDYSEDEDSTDNERLRNNISQETGVEYIPELPAAQQNDMINHTTLNTNVSEFVPRRAQASKLNVEVPEFLPRNYEPKVNQTAIPDPHTETTLTPADIPPPIEDNSRNETKSTNEETTEKCMPSNSASNSDSRIEIDKDKNIDEVIVKADLVDKIVINPKVKEINLENVKKINNKLKAAKASPKKEKQNISKAKALIVAKNTVKSAQNSENDKKVEFVKIEVADVEILKKIDQPTYAQMVGPSKKPLSDKPKSIDESQISIDQQTADLMKSLETEEKKIGPTVEVPKWQTVRTKGKKKQKQVQYVEGDGPWDLPEIPENLEKLELSAKFEKPEKLEKPEKSVKQEKLDKSEKPEKLEITQKSEKTITNRDIELNISKTIKSENLRDEIIPSVIDSASTSDTLSIKPKISTKDKAKKSKSKKTTKKAVTDVNSNGEIKLLQPILCSTPKKTEAPLISTDSLTNSIDDSIIDGVDISNYSFETNPSIFVNAITNGIYTNVDTVNTSTGFALNSSLNLMKKFDFCKIKENIFLKEEEEVMRVMKSLNEKERKNKDIVVNFGNSSITEEKKEFIQNSVQQDDIQIENILETKNEQIKNNNIIDNDYKLCDIDNYKTETKSIIETINEVFVENEDIDLKPTCNGFENTIDDFDVDSCKTENENNLLECNSKNQISNRNEDIYVNVHETIDDNQNAALLPKSEAPLENTTADEENEIKPSCGYNNNSEIITTDNNKKLFNGEVNGNEFETNFEETLRIKNKLYDESKSTISLNCHVNKENGICHNDNSFSESIQIDINTNSNKSNRFENELIEANDEIIRIVCVNENGIYVNNDLEDNELSSNCIAGEKVLIENKYNENEINVGALEAIIDPVNEMKCDRLNKTNTNKIREQSDDENISELSVEENDNKILVQLDENLVITNHLSTEEIVHDEHEIVEIRSNDEDNMILDLIDSATEAIICQRIAEINMIKDDPECTTTTSQRNEINFYKNPQIFDELLKTTQKNIFIEKKSGINHTDIVTQSDNFNIFNETKRIQSPRHSEDSGILENQDDIPYFTESTDDQIYENGAIRKYPITEAVSRWLVEKQKEKSPEPLLRLPNDPMLSEQIGKSIQKTIIDIDDVEISDSDTEYELKPPPKGSKNLNSNSLHASFVNQNLTTTIKSIKLDDHDRYNRNDNACKRVAIKKSDNSLVFDEPDILECWENEPEYCKQSIRNDVLKHTNHKNSDLDVYESVYGNSIDYANLLSNNDIFLSNNILNYDSLNETKTYPKHNNNNSPLDHKNIIINDKNESKNLNCFKPPEICCILM